MLTDDPSQLMSADELMRVAAGPPVMSMTGSVTMQNHLHLQRQASSQLSGSDSQTEKGCHSNVGADSEAASLAVKPSEQEQKPGKQEGSKTAH